MNGERALSRARDELVERVGYVVHDRRVLRAMREVPRHRFVPAALEAYAYEDIPLAIGAGQTISQPTVVAMMSAAAQLAGGEHVLEIGTGSGYQAAVLARLAGDVVSVEVVDELRERATMLLDDLGVSNVRVLAAGDVLGSPEHAPYDAIVVTAAAPRVPQGLVDQLRMGGRIVIPVGSMHAQELLVVTRAPTGLETRSLGACRFVPLVGPEGFTARRPAPPVPRASTELAALRAGVAAEAVDERAAALSELASAGAHLGRDALARVRRAIDEASDPGERMALVHDYLAVLEPPDAGEALGELLRHRDAFVRDAALDAVPEVGARALGPLRRLAADTRRDPRWLGVEGLARLASANEVLPEDTATALVDALIAALEDEDFAIRWAAAHGLTRIGEPAFEPLLHALVARPATPGLHRAARRVLQRVAPPGADDEGRLSALLDALRRATTVYESGGLASELLDQRRRERLGLAAGVSTGEAVPGAAFFEHALERVYPRLGAGRDAGAYRVSLQAATVAVQALIARDPELARLWAGGDPRRAAALLEVWGATVALALLGRGADARATCDAVARGVAWLFDADQDVAAAELEACRRQREADLGPAAERGADREPVAWTLLYLRSLRALGADVPPLASLALPVSGVDELAREGGLPAAAIPPPAARRRAGEILAHAVADAERAYRALERG